MKSVRNTLLVIYINFFLVILLFILLVGGIMKNNIGNWMQWLLIAAVIVSSILNVKFAVKNVKNAFMLYRNNEYNSLRKYMKILKLGVIPYFILNFVINFFIFMALLSGTMGVILVTPIPLLFMLPIFFTYLNVLFTSSYGIGFATIINKEKRSNYINLIIHILLQLCFVLDVISTIILLIKYKVRLTKNS